MNRKAGMWIWLTGICVMVSAPFIKMVIHVIEHGFPDVEWYHWVIGFGIVLCFVGLAVYALSKPDSD